MNFLCRPDAEALLGANDFARLWPFFTNMGATDARACRRRLADRGGARALPRGLARRDCAAAATTTAPRRCGRRSASDDAVLKIELASGVGDRRTCRRSCIWAEDDIALPVALARRPRRLRSGPARRACPGSDALDRSRASGARRRRDRARARALGPNALRARRQARGEMSRIMRSTARCTSGLALDRLHQPGRGEPLEGAPR